MQAVDVVAESPISHSIRARQVSSMFDAPAQGKARIEWHGSIPIDEKPWNVGLIVGPSGSGKSTLLRHMFGDPARFDWCAASVIDDFSDALSVEEITGVCQAVGFNTIPSWLRPKETLSNGEQFRVELARLLLEGGEVKVMDEFTSVVDRRVAKIGTHAVQKWVRKNNERFVAASCHFDLEEWLQPDWVLEPATMTFRWRSVQRRPELACHISRLPYSAWRIFSRFHYLTATLNRAAVCFGCWCEGELAAFCAVLYRPHPKRRDVWGISRIVTLPDFQGLGLAFALSDRLGAAYRALGRTFRNYPAHPPYVRSCARSPAWRLVKAPSFSPKQGASSSIGGRFGGRPCAVFEYCGPSMDVGDARRLVATLA